MYTEKYCDILTDIGSSILPELHKIFFFLGNLRKILRLYRKFSAKLCENDITTVYAISSLTEHILLNFSTVDQKLFNVLLNVSNEKLSIFGRPF